MADWKEMRQAFGGRNYLLEGDGFSISYNPDTHASFPGMALFGGDGDGEETALCHNGKYHILNGDFREAYERLLPDGFEACKRFYDQQAAHADSSWSSQTADA